MTDFKLDSREFRKALEKYYTETGKDLAYVVNRASLNVAIKASQNTPIGDAAKIKALPQTKAYWPKFVSSMLKGKGVTIGRGKRRKKVQGAFTRSQARQASKAIIRRKLSQLRWLKSGWAPAIKKLSALKLSMKGGAGLRDTKAFREEYGGAMPARDGFNPTAVIENRAPRNSGGLGIVNRALQTALNLAGRDMMAYLKERGQKTANRFSGRR